MALGIRSSQDFWTGCVFIGFGAGTVALSLAHPLGTAARMGPGFFPTALGGILAVIGLVILLKSLAGAPGEKLARIDWWLLARVLLSVVAFAVLLNPLGLVLTTIVVVVVAAWAGHEFRLGEALVNAIVLAGLSYVLFIWGLNQAMPVWPRFIAS